jgi:hypothetical protein
MRRVIYILRQFGLDPIRFLNASRFISRYLRNYLSFRSKALPSVKVKFLPSLNDFNDSAGAADGHYFWQDLICAQWINEENPEKHFDVGSRVDGFIAHLLASREIILLDIRPLPYEIPRLTIIEGDIQMESQSKTGTYPSISSLHSIEHFGLGRYMDPIDPFGHEKGLLNLAAMVSEEGSLYVSFPIGAHSVEFNSQRIIDPVWPQELLKNFVLEKFVVIPWKGVPKYNATPSEVDRSIFGQAGLYKFRKRTQNK